MRWIDLNCDMGEVPEAIGDGTQEALMQSITSVNVACGGHAGDEQSMAATILQALSHNMALGAHPGYPDPANFGRLEMHLTPAEIATFVYDQVAAFGRVAERLEAPVTHIKAHGALYNQAVHNDAIARAIAEGAGRWSRAVILVGLAGSRMLDVFREAGFRVASEAFADRRYEPDGTLRNRRFADALIRDPEAAAAQALQMIEQGSVTAVDGSELPIAAQTICIHSDTPGAAAIASTVALRLKEAGIGLASLRG